MRVVDRLNNKAEELAFRELDSIGCDNGYRLFVKPRFSDVIEKGDVRLSQREFDFYTRSHIDFVIADRQTKPLIAVEYDGPVHSRLVQQERDAIKDSLCLHANLGLLRINANHVTRRFKGMSVLRWIVEILEREKEFYEAQKRGFIPNDEPFVPWLAGGGTIGESPYWLSADDIKFIRAYLKSQAPNTPKGRFSIEGADDKGNLHQLSYIRIGEQIVWSKTAVKHQGLDFPIYDLLDEVATCELGLKLRSFHRNGRPCTPILEFKETFVEFIKRYRIDGFSAEGKHPFNISWSPAGWTFP